MRACFAVVHDVAAQMLQCVEMLMGCDLFCCFSLRGARACSRGAGWLNAVLMDWRAILARCFRMCLRMLTRGGKAALRCACACSRGACACQRATKSGGVADVSGADACQRDGFLP